MIILTTNDDGVHSTGFNALIEELKTQAEVIAIAPETERSAAGHSVTFYNPIRYKKLRAEKNLTLYSCNGTPTDCILLGVAHFLEGKKPDLIISGINYGSNLGDDVSYSGTASAALEGAQMGITSMAISTGIDGDEVDSFKRAAKVAATFSQLLYKHKLPYRTFLNVNLPATPFKGLKLTHVGVSKFEYGFLTRKDAGDREYQWLTRIPNKYDERYEGSDYQAIDEGFISVSPIKLEYNDTAVTAMLESWDFSQIKNNV